MKIQKKKMGGSGWGGGRVWGGGGVQGGCEWRSEAFVKIQKKKNLFEGGVGSGGGSGWGVRVDGNGEVKLGNLCENSKKKKNGVGVGVTGVVLGGGVRSGVGVGEVG